MIINKHYMKINKKLLVRKTVTNILKNYQQNIQKGSEGLTIFNLFLPKNCFLGTYMYMF